MAGDLELAVADGHEDALLIQLRDEARQRVELGVGKQAYKVGAVARRDVVALQVQRDVAERQRVAIDVEGAHRHRLGGAVVLLLFELAEEVLREVGWCLDGDDVSLVV